MLYRYPDVLEPQVKFFRTHALSDPRTRSGLQQKIRDAVKGEMPHCQNVLISLLQELQAPAMSQPDTSADAGNLVMSITRDNQANEANEAPIFQRDVTRTMPRHQL